MAGGRPFAMDNRAPKMLGKLIIDLGVDSGGIYDFGLNRGFHVYGGKIFHCDLTYDNRKPVDINTVPYPYNGSHRFVASGEGHSGFDDKKYWPALGIAWGVPKENMDYAAGL